MDNSQRPQPAQHTPGPWHRLNLEWGFSFKRYNPGKGFEQDWEFVAVTIDQAASAPDLLAEVTRLKAALEYQSEVSKHYAITNAKLVKALEGVLEASEDGGTMNDIDWSGLRAALAAAKGVS